MAMNVSAWAIRKPVPSLVLFAVLMALGWFSFMQLPVTKFPNVDIPIVSVTVQQPGASAVGTGNPSHEKNRRRRFQCERH